VDRPYSSPTSENPPYPTPLGLGFAGAVREAGSSPESGPPHSRLGTPFFEASARGAGSGGLRLPHIQTHRLELGELFQGVTPAQPTTSGFAACPAPEREVQFPVVARVVDYD
jgi:hypothetical protein